MGTKTAATPQQSSDSQKIAKLLDQYSCGRLRFSGTENALYERHLFFDSVIDEAGSTARDRFEAFARSIRDVLSQRWILTNKTYEQQNPKRLYYLSMEFLIGRSLANNVTNLLLDPLGMEAVRDRNLNWLEVVEEEPDAGLGNGGLGRLAACFIESAATMQPPCDGIRSPIRIRHLQAVDSGWMAAGAAGQLAPVAGPMGGGASQ